MSDALFASRAAVIGWPLGHSISPTFQQAAFDALALPVTYRAVPVAPDGLEAFVTSLRHTADGEPRWLGVNVTIPHKQAIAALVDDLTEEARQIGAVNTVICRDGRLVGHNTDATGFMAGMRDVGVDPTGMGALVVGAGGAARTHYERAHSRRVDPHVAHPRHEAGRVGVMTHESAVTTDHRVDRPDLASLLGEVVHEGGNGLLVGDGDVYAEPPRLAVSRVPKRGHERFKSVGRNRYGAVRHGQGERIKRRLLERRRNRVPEGPPNHGGA